LELQKDFKNREGEQGKKRKEKAARGTANLNEQTQDHPEELLRGKH